MKAFRRIIMSIIAKLFSTSSHVVEQRRGNTLKCDQTWKVDHLKTPFTCPSGLPYWYITFHHQSSRAHRTAVDWLVNILWVVIKFLTVSAVWWEKTDVLKDINTKSWRASSHRTVIIPPVCLENDMMVKLGAKHVLLFHTKVHIQTESQWST